MAALATHNVAAGGKGSKSGKGKAPSSASGSRRHDIEILVGGIYAYLLAQNQERRFTHGMLVQFIHARSGQNSFFGVSN